MSLCKLPINHGVIWYDDQKITKEVLISKLSSVVDTKIKHGKHQHHNPSEWTIEKRRLESYLYKIAHKDIYKKSLKPKNLKHLIANSDTILLTPPELLP